MYSTVDLKTALQRLARVMPVAFTIRELDRALRLALPHFLPAVLDPDEQYHRHNSDDTLAVADVRIQASALLGRLDHVHRIVIAMKLAGSSDAEVGEALRVSRRTATNRKAAAYALIEEQMQPLNHIERLAVLDRVAPELRAALIQTCTSTPANPDPSGRGS